MCVQKFVWLWHSLDHKETRKNVTYCTQVKRFVNITNCRETMLIILSEKVNYFDTSWFDSILYSYYYLRLRWYDCKLIFIIFPIWTTIMNPALSLLKTFCWLSLHSLKKNSSQTFNRRQLITQTHFMWFWFVTLTLITTVIHRNL